MTKNNSTARRDAILEGAKAAGDLHTKLGLQKKMQQSLSAIDIYGAISELEIFLMFRDLDGPLGLCLKQPTPGIIINRGRPPMMQRFTAAHELGHLFMDHLGSIDHKIFELVDSSDNMRPLEEIAADAFASEFLMPKWLLILHTRKHGWASKAALTNPGVVYQLSLRVGVSFEAIGWVLRSQDILTQNELKSIQATTPQMHKMALLGGRRLENPWNDVWHLTAKDSGLSYSIRQGDYVVVELPSLTTSGYVWELDSQSIASSYELVEDTYLKVSEKIGAGVTRRLIMLMRDAGEFQLKFKEVRPWKKDSVLSTFQTNLTVSEPESGGLPNITRMSLAS